MCGHAIGFNKQKVFVEPGTDGLLEGFEQVRQLRPFYFFRILKHNQAVLRWLGIQANDFAFRGRRGCMGVAIMSHRDRRRACQENDVENCLHDRAALAG